MQPRTLHADRPATIAALLQKSVERSPEADAIAMIGEVLSYRQLERRTIDMAAALVAVGVGKGTRLALLAPDGILWATVFLAATRIGALVIAISTHATAPEMAHILRHSDTQMLIGVRRFLRHDYADRLGTAFPQLDTYRDGPLYLEDAPFLRSIWLDDTDGLGWASPHADLEGALRTLADVALPIVLPLSDPVAGQIVVAAVVPAVGTAPTEDELKAALRNLVASYKIPRRILVIAEEDVQWTPSNKIKVGEMATLISERIGHAASKTHRRCAPVRPDRSCINP